VIDEARVVAADAASITVFLSTMNRKVWLSFSSWSS
jgi:hypothetical protein